MSVMNSSPSLKMVDQDHLTQQLLHTVLLKNVSTAAAVHPSRTEDSLARNSGIIPGAIAAAVFIAFILVLYTILWKCMVSSPKRKMSKIRVRVQQRTSV